MGTVISSGTRTVKSGQTLDQPTIMKSGTVVVSSGGLVSFADITSSGYEIVSSGGIDSGSIITSWGSVLLKDGGGIYNTDVYDKGYITAMGGSIYSANIGSNSEIYFIGGSSGGSVTSGYISKVTIKNFGGLILGAGVTGSDVRVSSGHVTVSSGGFLQQTIVSGRSNGENLKRANVYVESGGKANITSVSWEGEMDVKSTASATSTFVYAGGCLLVLKGGFVNSTSLLGGLADLSGGTAVNTTLDSGGVFKVVSGGSCSNTTITSGTMNIYNGTVASNTTLIKGSVSNYGESVSGTYSSGIVYVNCGSSISEKLLGGEMRVSGSSTKNYGYVRNLTVQSAHAYIYSNTYLEGATVSKGGIFYVSSGARASSVDVMSGGSVAIASGGYLSGGSVYGVEAIGSSAIAWGIKVMSGGSFKVYGSADDCTVAGGGSVTVTSGGVFTNGVVSSGVILAIESGGTATVKQTAGMSASINDGMLTLISGAAGYAILKNGTINISSGAYLGNTVVSAGTMTLFAGGSVGNVQLGSGSETRLNIQSGAEVHYAIVSGSSATVKVSSGGILTLASIIGANVTVNGRVNSSYLTSGGNIAVFSGGIVTRADLTSDSFLNIRESGMASNVVVSNRGYVNVSSGGSLKEAVINHSNGAMTVSIGGKCTNATVVSGNMYISSGGTATATALLEGGLFIYGQSVSGSFSGGNVLVSGGSSIKEELLGGEMYVYATGGDVGYASGLTIQSATAGFYSGTRLDAATVSAGGRVNIGDGARANNVNVTLGGAVSIESGGFADDVNLRGGVVSCCDGARMDGDVSSDGVARFLGGTTGGLTVSSGGNLSIVKNLAMSTGKITFAAGGNLDFDISSFTASSDTPLFGTKGGKGYDTYIANLADAACSLTVGDTQLLTEATYVLASEASTFNSTITVKYASAGVEFGTLTVGGTTKIGDMNFTLSRSADNALSVTVAAAVPAASEASSDIDGNGTSDVLFQYIGGQGQIGFWMNGTSTWQSTNSTHPTDVWEVLGAYDMNANGKADSVLVGNTEIAGIKGAFIGYYLDAEDYDSNWVNISYLTNSEGYVWKNKVGNLTGNRGMNSIVWHTTDIGALGVWTDGTDHWESLGAGYDSNWTLIGCGDFDGDGKDSVVMSYLNGSKYYAVDLDETLEGDNKGVAKELATSDSGWEVRAIGDFYGDGKDDIIAFHKETGLVAMWGDGNSDNWSQLGQLDPADWFVVGAGDYTGDGKDDILVRQYSTGMLGYYGAANMDDWIELGRGVDMSWTVIA